MLSQILDTLQVILIPLLIGLGLIGGCAVFYLGRPPGKRQASHSAAQQRAPAPADDAEFQASEFDTPPPATTTRPAGPTVPLIADLLLVDDSAVARAKLRRLFEPSGYRVALARDGLEALALLGKGGYALMITDLEMPNMDGVELISTCLGNPATADMPILAITGHDDLQAKLNECHEICGIYRKPWIDDDLLNHVEGLVAKPAAYRTSNATA